MEVLRGELDEMLEALGSGHLVDKEPEPEPEPMPDSDTEPETESELESEPSPEPEPELDLEPKSEPAPEPKEDDRDKIIEDLRLRLAKKEEYEKSLTKEEEPPEDEPLVLDNQDFIGDEDIDDIVRDKDMFNKLLNSVYTKGVADARKLTSEKVLLSIPDIVRNNIDIVTNLKKMSDQFYDTNKDLVPFKKVVATVFEEIASENADKKYVDIMKLVAPEVRKRLELHQQAVGDIKDKTTPKLPTKKGGQRQSPPKPETSSLQMELDEMNKIVRR